MQSIADRLDGLSETLAPLRDAAQRYLSEPCQLAANGVMEIAHRPWVATENYLFTLYPGVPAETIERYADRSRIQIPALYAEFLREMNGAFCFGMSLCGLPMSMLGHLPRLDRSILQCHDLGTAATLWVDEYSGAKGLFHFGGRQFSPRENVGYFIDQNQRILCRKHRGKVIGEWSSFRAFLADELRASEELEQTRRPRPPK